MPRPLVRNRLAIAEQVRNHWALSPEAGITIDEVMQPEFTLNVCGQFKPWDVIEVRPDDEAYYATLLVKTAEKSGATYWLTHFVELAPRVSAPADDRYTVGWGGPNHRHRVVRKSDGEVLKHGFASPAEAHAWAVEHAKAMA